KSFAHPLAASKRQRVRAGISGGQSFLGFHNKSSSRAKTGDAEKQAKTIRPAETDRISLVISRSCAIIRIKQVCNNRAACAIVNMNTAHRLEGKYPISSKRGEFTPAPVTV
ncbi:MAG: hypothetical protein ACK48E_05980, partial [Holosporales bacterium]